MARVKPFFITGANAKIKLAGKTLAFCTDLSYTVQVLHQTPKILGMYEGSSVEPLGYSVSGSFTVVRYAKDVKGNILEDGSSAPPNTNNSGNGVGNWGNAWSSGKSFVEGISSNINDSRANEALNPSRLDSGTTFDIEVMQLVPNTTTQTISELGVAKIRSARITQADFSLSKKNAAIQRFTFTALYVDEDSFQADFSGRGQQFEG